MKLVSCGGSLLVSFIFKLMNKISMTVLWRSRLNSSDWHELWLTTKFSCPCVYLCTRFLCTCETHLWLWCLYVCSQLWRWVMYRDGMWRHWPFCCKKSSEIAMLAILDELFSLRSAAFSLGFTLSFETCCVGSHIWWAKCEFYVNAQPLMQVFVNDLQKESEQHLPLLAMRGGINLQVEDFDSDVCWNFRYRWANAEIHHWFKEISVTD